MGRESPEMFSRFPRPEGERAHKRNQMKNQRTALKSGVWEKERKEKKEEGSTVWEETVSPNISSASLLPKGERDTKRNQMKNERGESRRRKPTPRS